MYVRRRMTVVLAILLLAAVPTMAQDTQADEPDEGDDGGFFLELGTWIAQATGTGLVGATRIDPNNAFATDPIAPDHGTVNEMYYLGGYRLPRNQGRFTVRWYDHSEEDINITGSTPGSFNYGEVLAHPLFAGLDLDGLADAFSADFALQLTDGEIKYGRQAFSNSRLTGDWFVGWRRVKHSRSTNATYSALIPGFPPLLPPLTQPNPALDPADDIVAMTSSYEGRGLSVGMDFNYNIIDDFLTIDGGVALTAMRGDTSVSYQSTTRYYVMRDLDDGGNLVLLQAPYSEFGENFLPNQMGQIIPKAAATTQRQFRVGINDRHSTDGSILDTHIALRWKIWKEMELLTGFRQTRYENIATEMRPEVTTTTAGVRVTDDGLEGVNVQNFSDVSRSATYEGFYFALSYEF